MLHFSQIFFRLEEKLYLTCLNHNRISHSFMQVGFLAEQNTRKRSGACDIQLAKFIDNTVKVPKIHHLNLCRLQQKSQGYSRKPEIVLVNKFKDLKILSG